MLKNEGRLQKKLDRKFPKKRGFPASGTKEGAFEMAKRGWREYNRSLVERGSLTCYIDRDCLDAPAKKKGTKGRARAFSYPLIRFLLLLKMLLPITLPRS